MNGMKESFPRLINLVYLLAAGGLRCNYCNSSSSFDECSSQHVHCPPGFDRCYKGTISYCINSQAVNGYGKGCTTAQQCSNNENLTCKNVKASGVSDVTCHMECCSSDHCNAGTGIKVSAIVILPCAMFVLGYIALL